MPPRLPRPRPSAAAAAASPASPAARPAPNTPKRQRIAKTASANGAEVAEEVNEGAKGQAAPPHFARQLELIKLLRRCRDAPVDTMGAHSLADSQAPDDVRHYQILTALQLSSQTRDQETAKAMEALKAHGLTVRRISETSVDKVRELIKTVGFYNRKAEFIKQTAATILNKHNGLVPRDLDELLALPGIGPKMAHLCMQCAFGVVSGIGVDTHVHRISNDLRWVKTKTPEETRLALEAFCPREEWANINLEVVGLGQMIKQPAHRPSLIATWSAMEPTDRKEAAALVRKLGLELE